MKILIFTTQFYHLGGAEQLAVELAAELNKRPGIRADLLSMYSEELPGVAEKKRTLLDKGIASIRFLGMNINPSILETVSAIRRLRNLLRESHYDIMETSLLGPAILGCWATMGLETRHVSGLHAVFRKKLMKQQRHRVWRLSVRLNRRVRYYAISKSVAEGWLEFSGTSPKYTRILPNSIDSSFFEAPSGPLLIRQELGIPADGRIVLCVGRVVKSKGVETLLEAVGPVLHRENLYLLYAGDIDHPCEGFFPGEDGLVDRMRQRALFEGWYDRVRFLGYRQDVQRLMASSDVLAHPTWHEGFGLVLAEALATGLPVVATNVDGVPEVLGDTPSLIVPPSDPDKLRSALLQTLNRSSEEAAKCAALGRKRSERFRTDRRIAAMITLFEDVLAGRF